MKHTPGPWTNTEIHEDTNNILIGSTSDYVAEVIQYNIDQTEITLEESKANAHLIAAAPKMLDALEIVALYLNDEPLDGVPLDVTEVLKEVERAITEAKGI